MALREKTTGSIYLDGEAIRTKQRKANPMVVAVSALLSFLILGVLFTPGLISSSKTLNVEPSLQASAGAFCQRDLGTGMGQGSWENWLRGLPSFPEDPTRVLTVDEAFGGALTYASYNGEGKGSQILVNEVGDRVAEAQKGRDGIINSEQLEKLEHERSTSNCIFRPIGTQSTAALLNVAHIISSISGFIAVKAFSPGLICHEPGNPDGDQCMDLLGTIGGFPPDATANPNLNTSTTANGGLIGSLTDSIYLPLLSLIAIVAAVSIAYKGIVQRKLREAMFQAIWVFGSVILGLTFLLNPWLLAKAPMNVSNALSGCIILSFSGNSCLDSTDATGQAEGEDLPPPGGEVCKADANVGPGEVMELVSIGLTCSVWKAFVLEPYSQGSFGQSYEAMDVNNPGTVLSAALEGKDDAYKRRFCVSTAVNQAVGLQSRHGAAGLLELKDPNDSENADSTICNVVTYQLFLKTKAQAYEARSKGENDPVYQNLIFDHTGSGDNFDDVDARWYNIIDVTSNEDALFDVWVGGFGKKLGIGFLAIIASILGGIVIAVVSIMALVYYVSSIFLMAFAPMFFLIGVHPGRGRDILKGYGEQVLSNVMKYVASALFLVVTLSLYGGVLGSSSNMGLTFLFVLILTVALLLYRKEIIELIGKVDMGGKQLSNKMSSYGKDVGKFGASITGSAIGAKAGGESLSKGLKDGVGRELKAGRVPVGGALTAAATRNMAQTFSAVGTQNRADMKSAAGDKKQDASKAGQRADKSEKKLENLIIEQENSISNLGPLKSAIDELKQKIEDCKPDAVLDRMSKQGPDGAKFAEAARLQSDIDQTDADISAARAAGAAPETIADMEEQKEYMRQLQSNIYQDLNDRGKLDGLMSQYDQEVNVDSESYFNELTREERKYNAAVGEINKLEIDIKSTAQIAENARTESIKLAAEGDAMSKASENRFGETDRKGQVAERARLGIEDAKAKAETEANDARSALSEKLDNRSKPNLQMQNTVKPQKYAKPDYTADQEVLTGTNMINPPKYSPAQEKKGLPGSEGPKVNRRATEARHRSEKLGYGDTNNDPTLF